MSLTIIYYLKYTFVILNDYSTISLSYLSNGSIGLKEYISTAKCKIPLHFEAQAQTSVNVKTYLCHQNFAKCFEILAQVLFGGFPW